MVHVVDAVPVPQVYTEIVRASIVRRLTRNAQNYVTVDHVLGDIRKPLHDAGLYDLELVK